jgi:hypothetical protein
LSISIFWNTCCLTSLDKSLTFWPIIRETVGRVASKARSILIEASRQNKNSRNWKKLFVNMFWKKRRQLLLNAFAYFVEECQKSFYMEFRFKLFWIDFTYYNLRWLIKFM